MSIFSIFKEVVTPITGLIDELHTSDDEKLAAKVKLLAIQTEMSSKVLEYEQTLAKEQGATIRTEATGHSWLQRNWRPIIMLLFAYIIAHNYVLAPVFGITATEIPPDMWTLLKIGIGGYVVGRSAEKVVPQVMAAMKRREEA